MVISVGSLVLKRQTDPLGDPEACIQKQISCAESESAGSTLLKTKFGQNCGKQMWRGLGWSMV